MPSARFWTIVTMILAAAATRLVPHPPNATAVFATALFAGAMLNRQWLALLVPLAAMAISDAVLLSTVYAGYGWAWSWPTYACAALTVVLGRMYCRQPSVGRVALAAVASSVLFFFVSNFAVWLGSTTYPQNIGGLVLCYLAALPFALNTVLGNLLYAGVLFGGLAALQRSWPGLREAPAAVAAR